MVRILVIEVDANVLAAIALAVSSPRYTVIATNDALEGMRIHEGNPVDLIITDSRMPQLGGNDITQEIRARYPNLKLVTMSAEQALDPVTGLTLAPARGVDATFVKPLAWEKLLKTIDTLTAHVT